MTESEITVAIQKWRKYAIFGDPKEPDYGDGKPVGFQSAGLEAQYQSPQIWEPPEPHLEATKSDYDFVEQEYAKLSVEDRQVLKAWYFEPRGVMTPTIRDREIVGRFRKSIGRANAIVA